MKLYKLIYNEPPFAYYDCKKKKLSFYVICNFFKYRNLHYFYKYITTQTHSLRKIILYLKFFAINVFC